MKTKSNDKSHESLLLADREDGFLQTYEIAYLDLASDMVVLSACETGLGRLTSGEGVVGLWRAFLYAGTDSLVVSMWKVSDYSTKELMVRFYRHLIHDEVSRSEALRSAQLEMMQRKGFGHPFHWAAFTLIGLPGKLKPIGGSGTVNPTFGSVPGGEP